MTIKYSENIKHIAGLQADSRRDRGDRVELIDGLLCLIRQLGIVELPIQDLQGYYSKTIVRKTAYHGTTGKLFNYNGLQLLVSWSQDCQYPLQLFVFDQGYIVGHILTLKQIQAHYEALRLLTVKDLAQAIDRSIANYLNNQAEILIQLNNTVKSSHYRYYRNQCLKVVKQFN